MLKRLAQICENLNEKGGALPPPAEARGLRARVFVMQPDWLRAAACQDPLWAIGCVHPEGFCDVVLLDLPALAGTPFAALSAQGFRQETQAALRLYQFFAADRLVSL